MAEENKIADALQVLENLGMPRAQQNDRSALCLLALLDLKQGEPGSNTLTPGIFPVARITGIYHNTLQAKNQNP